MDVDEYVFDSPPKAGREITGLEGLLSSVLGMKDGPVFGNSVNEQQQKGFLSRFRTKGKRD